MRKLRYGERLEGSLSASWRGEEDGSLSGTFRLPPLQGAVLLKALRAACADLAGDPRAGVSAETPAAPPPVPGDPADPVPVPGL